MGSRHVCAHNKVDNLIATIDRNGQQIDGGTEEVLALGDLRAKFEAFGWDVLEADGNDFENCCLRWKKRRTLQAKANR